MDEPESKLLRALSSRLGVEERLAVEERLRMNQRGGLGGRDLKQRVILVRGKWRLESKSLGGNSRVQTILNDGSGPHHV